MEITLRKTPGTCDSRVLENKKTCHHPQIKGKQGCDNALGGRCSCPARASGGQTARVIHAARGGCVANMQQFRFDLFAEAQRMW